MNSPEPRPRGLPVDGGKSSASAVPAGGASGVASRARSLADPNGLGGVLLVVAVLVAYLPCMHGGFVWDDETHISDNMALRTAQGLWDIWFRPGASFQYLQYYPLTFSVFWLEWHLWGLDTLGYHLVNIFLHATVALLLWQVLNHLKVRGAWLAAGIFALHPVCVMSVAWMTELKNTLSATLALCAAWAYMRAVGLGVYERPGPVKVDWRWYAGALALFQFALFAKTAVSFLPVTLLLITWWSGRGLNWRTVWPVLPMLLVAAGMGLLTIYVEHSPSGGATGAAFNLPLVQRALISGRSFWFYLGKLFFPQPLIFIYPRWRIDAGSPGQWLFPAATAAVLAAAWALRGKIGKGLFVALAHFYVSTSLLIFMVVLYMMRYSFVSDHWQYFGCMSVIAATAAGVVGVLNRWGAGFPQLKAAVCGLLLFGLGALTWRQCGMYANVEKLYDVTLERNPEATMAHVNLAKLYIDEGRVNDAIDHLQTAVGQDPTEPVAHRKLGVALALIGRTDDSIHEFQRAIELKPDFAGAYFSLGDAYYHQGHTAEAIEDFQKTVEHDTNFILAWNNLAAISLQQGRVGEAIDYDEKAVGAQPDDPSAQEHLGTILLGQGRVDEALPHLEKAAEQDPENPVLVTGLAQALLTKGRVENAIMLLRQVIQLNPKFAEAHRSLGLAFFRQRQAADALAEFRAALELEPENVDNMNSLAWLLATCPDPAFRDGPRAVELAKKADQLSGGKNTTVLVTLAAAFAEEGRATDASAAAQRALATVAQAPLATTENLRQQLARILNQTNGVTPH